LPLKGRKEVDPIFGACKEGNVVANGR